jgi:exodeoxyribonuclease-1
MAFIFYDTETTGTDTAFDQIIQFGAVKTDNEMNELDRFEIRCRLMPHIVPAPRAMQVTRVTPSMLTDPSLPSYFEAMQLIYSKMKDWSPATFFGYNSISFDENLMRQAFYQTLQPVYLTNTGGNTRGDVMRMLHATNIFAPNVISVPLNDKGNPTFRLDTLAPANGFIHDNAHDAISDVEATIFLSKLIRDRAPEIWRNMLELRSKQNVQHFIEENEVFISAEVIYGKPSTCWATHCGSNPKYNTEQGVFDLSFLPDNYIDLSVDDLVSVLNGKEKPIRIIKANNQPILILEKQVPESIKTENLLIDEVKRRAKQIQVNFGFKERVRLALADRFQDFEPSPYVEKNIYNGFPSNNDVSIMSEFQSADWVRRLEWAKQLTDLRSREMARRQIYFERPDLLSEPVRQELDGWLSDRLLVEDASVPWRTISDAVKEADALLKTTNVNDAAFMKLVKEFIVGLAQSN